MDRMFSLEKTNLKRQDEIDYSRGFTALILIICHVGLYLGKDPFSAASPKSLDWFLFYFSDIIGSEPAAPVFMALMGISAVYSRHQRPIDLLKRGIILFISGYILSFFRSLLPYLIFGEINEWTTISHFFVVDIFQFAGLSFMFLALLKKLKISAFLALIIAILFSFLSENIMVIEGVQKGLKVDNEWACYFINLFYHQNDLSCFPFLTWFYFPAFGYAFGEVLIRLNNKDKFYGITLVISIIAILLVYLKFHFLFPNYTDYYYGKNFYYMGIREIILTSFFIMFSLSFSYYIGKALPEFIKKYLKFLSKNLTIFYVISWIIIAYSMHIFSLLSFVPEFYMTLIIFFVVLFLCNILTIPVKKLIVSIKK